MNNEKPTNTSTDPNTGTGKNIPSNKNFFTDESNEGKNSLERFNHPSNELDALRLTAMGEGETPEQMNRRRFLSRISLAVSGLAGVIVAVPVVGYLVGPLLKETPETWRTVGTTSDFKVGETVEVSFQDASPLPWSGVVAQTAAWLRRESQDKFIAYSVNCTHLGCPVSWLPGANLFMCPCHGGVYYSDGTVAAGPPPQSLHTYDLRIVNNRVEIKATGIPIAG